MNISELLNNTNTFGGSRSTKGIFKDKKFGNIYINNKEIHFDVKHNAVTISIYFNAETQKDINMHRATVVLKDIEQEFIKSSDIKNFLRSRLGDKKLYQLVKENIDKQDSAESFETAGSVFGSIRSYLDNKLSSADFEVEDIDTKVEDIEDDPMWDLYNNNKLKELKKERNKQLLSLYDAMMYVRDNKIHSKYSGLEIKNAWEAQQDYIIIDFLKNINDPKFLEDYIKFNEEYLKIGKQAGYKEKALTKSDTDDFLKKQPNRVFIELVNNNPKIIPNKLIIPEGVARSVPNQEDMYYSRYIIIDRRIPLNTECQVNCSCFTGDTRVQLANGMSLSLKDLENMTDFKVLAYNTEKGKYEYARALNCTKRQENARIMKITLADGTDIRVTPSHRFLNNRCEWKQAQELEVGDLLKFNDEYWGYDNHEQKTSSSTFIYLDPTQEGDYQFGELKFTHKPFYVGITTGAFIKIENERCLEYLEKLANMNEQPIMFKQYYHVDEHVALQLKEKLISRIGTVEQGGLLVNNTVRVNSNYINQEDKYVEIIDIKELEEREDVYCLTVEGLGNFAIQTNKGNIIVENCADYYWTFAWANYMNKVHYGPKPPIYMNTYLRGEAVRNPKNVSGCCKHLVMLLSILMQEDLINSRESMLIDSKSCIKSNSIKEYNKKDLREKIIKMNEDLKAFRAKARELGRETRNIIHTLESGEYLKSDMFGQKSYEQSKKDIYYLDSIYDTYDPSISRDFLEGFESGLSKPRKDHVTSINKKAFKNRDKKTPFRMSKAEKRINKLNRKFW